MNFLKIFSFSILLTSFSAVQALNRLRANSTVCYDYLGCFDNNKPFDVVGLYEESTPSAIGTEFSLFTYDSPDTQNLLNYTNNQSIIESKFNKNLPLKIIVHGYSNTKSSSWLLEIKKELFKSENLNVLIVSWGEGAKYPYYDYAAVNSRIVGKELGVILNLIQEKFYRDDKQNFKIHCIGHSLGAHICSYAANSNNVFFDRITGLDPANKHFETSHHSVRIDARDAKFVDVIHTDIGDMSSGKFGIIRQTGTTDFYVNNGGLQPGCKAINYGNIDPNTDRGCSHNRAISYFIESINTFCPFTSFKCSSWEKYKNGECRSCARNSCSLLGYLSDNFRTLGSFYIATRDSAPYCGIQYLFDMKIDFSSSNVQGIIYFDLDNGKNSSETYQITDVSKGLDFEIKGNIKKLLVSKLDISGTEGNRIRFTKKADTGFWPFQTKYPDSFNYNKIEMIFFENHEIYRVCPSTVRDKVTSGEPKIVQLEDKYC